MAIPYKTWLGKTGRKGTGADAYLWKTTHGVALGKYNPDGSPYKKVGQGDLPAAPNAGSIAELGRQRDALPAVYNPLKVNTRDRAKAALSGYGDMFTWGEDNPATPEDESLIPKVNPEGKGSLHRDAYRSVNERNANRGTLYSSYRDREQTDARRDLGDRARAILNQYSDQLATIRRDRDNEYNRLSADITRLYGEDQKWLSDQGTV